ncbi:MAG: D-alanine--D-alanine ligase [Alphaproteobacteria bacterium]|nr:D-alanine--D-alanine ligase [Alphaproteobacteria bacterium]
MRIGLTYDLRSEWIALGYTEEQTAEFDSPGTIDAIEAALKARGFTVDRIGHARALMRRLAAGARWDIVFNICEGMHGYAREALVPALLEAYQIPCVFSDPLTCAVTLHKGMAKSLVRDAGLPTAPFALIERIEELGHIGLPYPLFAKPVAEGTGKGVDSASRCDTPEKLAHVCERLLARFRQPVLIETYLPGREFTVGIVGTGPEAEIVGTVEVILKAPEDGGAYGFESKEECETRVDYVARDDAEARASAALALASYRALGCRDGGRVDVRSDAAGLPHFIEVNPLAGLNPEHSDLPILTTATGRSYQWLIDRIVGSALARNGLAWPEQAKKRRRAARGALRVVGAAG